MPQAIFTPIHSLFGGSIVGTAAYNTLLLNGTILGCSGIFHSVVGDVVDYVSGALGLSGSGIQLKGLNRRDGFKWGAFAGFVSAGLMFKTFGRFFESGLGVKVFDPVDSYESDLVTHLAAAFAVGLGSKLANGCTSGHMLIGTSRMNPRSWISTLIFFPVAMFTANYFRTIYEVSPFSSSYAPMSTDVPSWPILLGLAALPFLGYQLASKFFNRGSKWRKPCLGFLLAFHFGVGLALSGMNSPSKILSFFAVPLRFWPFNIANRQWDLSVGMVILSGLFPLMFLYHKTFAGKNKRLTNTYGEPLEFNNNGKWSDALDWKLIVGSVVFGVGWGLGGICPGPAMVSAVNSWKFLGMMALGGQVASRCLL